MTTRACTVTHINADTVKFVWEGLVVIDTDPGAPVVEAYDDGVPIPEAYADYSDRSIQVAGVFGNDGALAIKGSLDGTNYSTLNDVLGSPLSFTAAGIKSIAEGALFTMPALTNGEVGVTDIDVTIICRRPRSGKGT